MNTTDKANEFKANTMKGTEFDMGLANLTGYYDIDGTVWFNYEGTTEYIFDSIDTFCDYWFHGLEVTCEVSEWVADLDIDTGEVVFHEGEDPLQPILDDDAEAVMSEFKTMTVSK